MTIDFSRIRVDLQEHERWRRTLSFMVPAEIMQREHDRTWSLLATRLKLPGFRKGMAPSTALERQHGPQVRQETLERVIGDVYRRALEERGIHPISEGRVEAAEYQLGRALTFQISFDVRPVIELSRLGGFQVERPTVRVEPSDVERALKRLLEENAIWLPSHDGGSPREGDLVTVQIVPLGESATAVGLPWARRLRLRPDTTHRGRYQFVLGEGDAVPDLERAVGSLVPGQTGEFDVLDDSGEPRSRELRLRVTLEDRRMRELPELDDAFARSLGNFNDVNELRSRILDDLQEEAAAQAEAVLGQRLLDQALAANPFEAPRSMVEQYMASVAAAGAEPGRAGQSLKELRREAEAAVKRALLFDQIADSEGLAATPAEVEARVEEIAALGQVTPDLVRSRLADSNRLEALSRDITERKVIEFLKSQSEIVEQS